MRNLIITTTIVFFLISCNKEDDKPKTELEKLPPATQIGANTFGCLLDGKVFTPNKSNNSLQCYYQLVEGKYYFYIRGSRFFNSVYKSIYIGSNKKQIIQGEIYDLKENIDNNFFGAYSIELPLFTTNSLYTGKLSITKFDKDNYIVSGTFWFDIIDNQGIKHEIREGRFDTQFTN